MKLRITLWIISATLGASILISVINGNDEVAKYLGLALVGIGTKLIESEEKSNGNN